MLKIRPNLIFCWKMAYECDQCGKALTECYAWSADKWKIDGYKVTVVSQDIANIILCPACYKSAHMPIEAQQK